MAKAKVVVVYFYQMVLFPIIFRWLKTDWNVNSGLAAMEIEMPTGYRVIKRTLKEIVRDTDQIKRNRFSKGRLINYYESVSIQEIYFP